MSVKFSLNYFFQPAKKNNCDFKDNGLFLKGDRDTALVLIHGLTGTPNEMKFLARYFNKNGYSVFCPLLAGHGHPVEVLQRCRWQDFYKSVRDCFLEVKKNSSIKYIFSAGLSMGALLSLLLAHDFPDDVKGVSCLSPTLFYDGWNVPRIRCLLPLVSLLPLKYALYFKEESPYGIKNEKIRGMVHKYYNSAKLEDIESIRQFGYPYMPVNLLADLNGLVKFLSNKFSGINIPVQLIQAKDDDMTSIKNSQLIYDKVQSKTKEMVLLENSYHVITADQERGKVALSMDNFFKRILNGVS